MKYTALLLCLFSITYAEKQLKLEDIERDNLNSERQVKQEKQGVKYSTPYPQKPQQLHYGFKPSQQTQTTVTKPAQLHTQTQQTVQYVPQAQTQYIYQQPQQQQPQYQPQIQYQQVQYQPQTQYQQYENVPYIVDNQINQRPEYYTQQYVYVQPYTSSSSNIQMVVDPKGNIKYVMYVPTQYVSATKQEATQSVGPQIFTQEPDYQVAPNAESQFITQPQLSPEPQTAQIQYIQQEKPQYVQKSAPQSLLDSYVPSVLQLQYYKQQQAQANAISSSPKSSSGQKSAASRQQVYLPSASSELTYSYQVPYAQYQK